MISGLTAKRNLSERRSAAGGGLAGTRCSLRRRLSPPYASGGTANAPPEWSLPKRGWPFFKYFFIFYFFLFRGRCRKWRLSLTPKSSAGCSNHGRSVTKKKALGLANTEASLTEVRMRRRMLQTCGILGNVVMRTYTWWPLY